MRLKANVPIVVNSGGCRQKDDLAAGTEQRLGQRYQFGSDTLPLKSYVNSEIRKITAITKICDRASNANEKILVPAGGHDVRVF